MKKLLCLMLALLLTLSLCACGSNENDAATEITPSPTAAATEGAAETAPEAQGSKTLVVYFSRTGEQYRVGVIDKGNTSVVADLIAEMTGADMLEILPEDDYYPYTYSELTDVAQKEQRQNARPAYKGFDLNLAEYDTIFIGAPVWWGDWPMIMYTFFEANQDALSGKTLIPFSTHEGSGLSGFDRKLRSAIPSANVLTGLAVQGSYCQNDTARVKSSVEGWLKDLGL